MKKKAIRGIVIAIVAIGIIWSAMVITDYIRAKNLKKPLFAISAACDQNGNGYYQCLGYDVRSVAKAFNGKEFIMYDMQFRLFGRGNGGKKTLVDNYRHNLGLIGTDKDTILNYYEALKYVTPNVSGKQETYTEYVDGNDVKLINMILYNGVVSGFEYEYHDLRAAYDFAKYLRKDLELTYGEKTTYPGMVQTNRDYFDNIKDVSGIKALYTYYEDWKPGFDYNRKENMTKMLGDKAYSRIDIRMELSVVDENKAVVSVRYIALP